MPIKATRTLVTARAQRLAEERRLPHRSLFRLLGADLGAGRRAASAESDEDLEGQGRVRQDRARRWSPCSRRTSPSSRSTSRPTSRRRRRKCASRRSNGPARQLCWRAGAVMRHRRSRACRLRRAVRARPAARQRHGAAQQPRPCRLHDASRAGRRVGRKCRGRLRRRGLRAAGLDEFAASPRQHDARRLPGGCLGGVEAARRYWAMEIGGGGGGRGGHRGAAARRATFPSKAATRLSASQQKKRRPLRAAFFICVSRAVSCSTVRCSAPVPGRCG